MSGTSKESPERRFWSYVNVKGKDECWLWFGSLTKKGYGHIRVGEGTISKIINGKTWKNI